MLRLLLIELHKLRYNKASIILSTIYFGLLTSVALIATIKFNIGSVKFNLSEQGIFNFPYIWHFTTYIVAGFKFFLLLVIVSMVSNEYTYKTIKQNLIDGLSKKEFILSKFYTIILFSLVSTVFVFVVSLILGLIYSDYHEFSIIFSDLEYLVAFFIKLVCFFSFGLFLGILIKRSAFALGGMFVWFIFENLIKLFVSFNTKISSKSIIQFLPLEAMSNLIKEPFSRLNGVQTIAKNIGQIATKDYSVHFLDILIVLTWTFIFIYSSYFLLKKRDL